MGLDDRLDDLEREVGAMRSTMKATWADSLQVSRQMLKTVRRLELQLRRLVETLEGPQDRNP